MTTRTTRDERRREHFQAQRRTALDSLTADELRRKVRALARNGARDIEIARDLGLPIGDVRAALEPERAGGTSRP